MKANIKRRILTAMKNNKGDDLERAEATFGGLPDDILDKKYGESGYTRREILEAYRKDRDEWHEAYGAVLEWLN